MSRSGPPLRSEADLVARQRAGSLRVCTTSDFRALVARDGLEAAQTCTDVVVAGQAEFCDQASLHLSLGPTDPPIRLRDPQLNGIPAQAGAGGELVLPISSGARVLGELLADRPVDLSAAGDATALQPRRELNTRLDRSRLANGRLLLHRGLVENGLVAVSSREGLTASPWGPLLGPFANALFSCGGADSIGLAMPELGLLGPGSPLLVGGAIGWVMGAGSGHHPGVRRLPSGHARGPGAVAALCVDLHDLQAEWLRVAHFDGQGGALLVAIAAPVPLLEPAVAARLAVDNRRLEAPVLDVSIPRRIKPSFGGVPYAQLLTGRIQVDGRRLRAAPAHSPRLAKAIAERLVQEILEGRFPLRLPLLPLSARPTLQPLDP
ncbi:MAG: homocysteine biosynthesis protein [Cyanobacteriota bacterium]|nr:homocysteine biosynthesis protein [Cyanobacteriota bacterium]